MAPRNTRVAPTTEVRSPARSFLSSLDNFYAPERDRRGEQSLQEGLGAFSGILQEQATLNKNAQRADETQQGIADAMREAAGQEMQGVRTGSIFRQNSRFYMAGLNETRGRAAAQRFKNETALAYEQWEGRHTDDDGTAFREWMNGRVSDFMGTLGDDQYRIAGALPVINETANNWAAQHTGQTAQRLETESLEAYDEIIAGVFDDLAGGAFTETDADGNTSTDWDTVVERIANEADDMYNTDGAVANDRVVQSAIRYANIHNDPDAILALARAHDSGALPLSLANQERLADAMDAVEADIARTANRTNAEQTAAQRAQEQATMDNWAAVLEENPYAELPSSTEVGGADIWRDMATLQDAYIKASGNVDPRIENVDRINLEIELDAAESTSAKIAILNDFVQANPNALTGAQVSSYSNEIMTGSDPAAAQNNPVIARGRSSFGEQLGSYEIGDGYDTNTVATIRTQGERYYNQYIRHRGGSVDMQDPSAIDQLIQEARDFAVTQLTNDFPMIMREKSDGPLAGVLGVDEAIAEQDNKIAEEYARLAEEEAAARAEESINEAVQIAEDLGLGEGIDTSNSIPPTPLSEQRQQEAEPENPADLMTPDVNEDAVEGDLPLEEQPAPFEDPDSDEPYTPTRAGFYGELIHRFTDGEDTRTPREVTRAASIILSEDTEFAAEVTSLADDLQVPESALMAIMDFETGGTFDPNIRNAAGSGATGLIQFMPQTARQLGTTTEELSRMSRGQQMAYVRRYFEQFGSRLHGGDVNDLYMAVLWPAAIGKPNGYVLFRSGTVAYRQNAGLDHNNDGTITKFEAASSVRARLNG